MLYVVIEAVPIGEIWWEDSGLFSDNVKNMGNKPL